jgi:hypothetical protein
MWPGLIVVADVFLYNASPLMAVKDEYVIQALALQATDHALTMGISLRSANRCLQHVDATAVSHNIFLVCQAPDIKKG